MEKLYIVPFHGPHYMSNPQGPATPGLSALVMKNWAQDITIPHQEPTANPGRHVWESLDHMVATKPQQRKEGVAATICTSRRGLVSRSQAGQTRPLGLRDREGPGEPILMKGQLHSPKRTRAQPGLSFTTIIHSRALKARTPSWTRCLQIEPIGP